MTDWQGSIRHSSVWRLKGTTLVRVRRSLERVRELNWTSSLTINQNQENPLALAQVLKIVSGDEKRDVVVVWMDAGNENDDELAAWLLMNNFLRNYVVFFIQVPGADGLTPPGARELTAVQHLQSNIRVQRMREVFPEQFRYSDIWSPSVPEGFEGARFQPPSTFILCTHTDFLQMANYACGSCQKNFEVKWWLQIAPLFGITFFELVIFKIESRIVMGDLEHPEKSINCTKAIPRDESGGELRAGYYSQEETFKKISKHTQFIPTDVARKVPTPMCFVERLPESMKEPILDTAFRQFVGRPDPKFPWAEDICDVNHRTIMMMLPPEKMYEILSQPTDQRLIKEVIEFLKPEIERREAVGDAHIGDFYPLRLGQIATAVEFITGVQYKPMPKRDSGCATQFQLNDNVDSLVDSDLARKNWMTYISENNCDLTPCYDGMAVLYMMYSAKRSGLVPWAEGVPSIEWCKNMLRYLPYRE